RNGLLDPNENDGDASPPLDNHNGVLDHGWVAFLTAHSRESNLRADGRPKIHLNNGLLTDLFDQVEEEFGETTAKFVVAIRLNSPKSTAPATMSSTTTTTQANNKPTSTTTPRGQQQKQQQAVQGLTKAIASAALSPGGKVTRGGIDISAGGTYTITSPWTLFGAVANATVNGSSTDMPSPWPADPNQLKAVVSKLLDTFTLSEDEFLEGRININQARREILMGIPVLTEDLVEKIILAQKLDSNGQPSPDVIQNHRDIGWLYYEGLVDIPTMATLEPYFTARGDVYRAQVFGFYDGGGPITRLEAMVDGTQKPPRIIFQRDLNDLGHGYSRTQIFPVVRQ
ncbi:MAG TPA: hypothetical protein VGM98_14500, partial [Schlesneria sp.]